LYVVQQIFLRDLQTTVGICRLQVLKRKATAFHYVLPEVNPSIAKPASTVVKDPSFARHFGF
jgi:hypothetical protein